MENQPKESNVEEFRPTHTEIVDRAVRYLKHTRKCGVVFSEFTTGASEIPDAIGWRSGGAHSILVECKASRADFLADKKKPGRQVDQAGWAGLGYQRYYMMPPGIATPEEMPPYWGLLIWYPSGKIFTAKESKYKEPHLYEEIRVLYSACRRAQLRGIDLMFKGELPPGQVRKKRRTAKRGRRYPHG